MNIWGAWPKFSHLTFHRPTMQHGQQVSVFKKPDQTFHWPTITENFSVFLGWQLHGNLPQTFCTITSHFKAAQLNSKSFTRIWHQEKFGKFCINFGTLASMHLIFVSIAMFNIQWAFNPRQYKKRTHWGLSNKIHLMFKDWESMIGGLNVESFYHGSLGE